MIGREKSNSDLLHSLDGFQCMAENIVAEVWDSHLVDARFDAVADWYINQLHI